MSILPKLPVFSGGDPTYDGSGNPMLEATGADLAAESAFIQTAASKAAAESWIAGSGLRPAIVGDSQTGNAMDRMYGALGLLLPYTFSSFALLPGTGAATINETTDALASYGGAQWSSKLSAVTGGTDLEAGYTSLGLTTDALIEKYVPYPFLYIKNKTTATTKLCQLFFSAQWTRLYDAENFESAAGVRMRVKFFIIDNGSNLPASYRMRFLHANSTPANTNTYTADTAFADSNRYHMGDGYYLTELISEPVTHYAGGAASASWPGVILSNSTTGNFNSAEALVLGGVVQLLDGADEPIDGFGITSLFTASGRNPEVWIGGTSGRVTGLAAGRTQHGSQRNIRQAMHNVHGDPNHYLICFGHNNPTRLYADSSYYGANSAFQRDHFDLCYQIAEDHFSLHSSYPSFGIVIPWEASAMDATRRQEIIGNINALNRLGIPAYPIDLFAYWLGDTSNYGGDGIHPDSGAKALALWGPFQSLVQAIAEMPVGSSLRARSQIRSRRSVIRSAS